MKPLVDEDVPGYAGDMLLDQRAAMGEEIEPVRGKEVLELKAVHAGGVGLLDVEIVVVVVVRIYDSDPERGRVAEGAEIHPVRVKVLHHRHVAINLDEGVHLLQSLVEGPHFAPVVDHRVPERRLSLCVRQRNDLGEAPQALIGDWQVAVPLERAQIAPKAFADREGGFFTGRRGGLVLEWRQRKGQAPGGGPTRANLGSVEACTAAVNISPRRR